MTQARMPRIEKRSCSRPEFRTAGVEVTYLAFVEIPLRTGWYNYREQLIGMANTREKLASLINDWRLKKEN